MSSYKVKKSKRPVNELNAQLKAFSKFDSEKTREMRERRVARLSERQKYLDAQVRTNLRKEYDRLVGEIPSVVRMASGETPIVAGRVASALYRRVNDLKGLYKQSFAPVKHEIEKK